MALDNLPKAVFRTFQRYILYAPTPGVEGKRARLQWGFRDDMPRISVSTNDPNDKVMNGLIYAGISPVEFNMFLEKLKQMTTMPRGSIGKVDCKGMVNEEKRTLSEIRYGKNSDGFMWIGLYAPERPFIIFKLGVSDWHGFCGSDGVQISDEEASCLYTRVMADMLTHVYNTCHALEFDKLSTRQQAYKDRFAAQAPTFKPAETNPSSSSVDSFGDISF